MAKRPAPGHDRPKVTTEGGPQDGGSAGAARKGILIRVQPEGWKALRHLAIEKPMEAGRTVTLQEVWSRPSTTICKSTASHPRRDAAVLPGEAHPQAWRTGPPLTFSRQ